MKTRTHYAGPGWLHQFTSLGLGVVNRFPDTLRTSQYRTNVVRSFAAKSFKRIWPPVMMGVFVVLEVAWIIFLVRVFVRFVIP